MADDFKKMRAAYDKLAKKELKDFSLAECKKGYKALEDAYKACIKLEDELIKTLPGARSRGVNGDDVRSFLRDPEFKKAYKELDKAVDVIDAAEKKANSQSIQAEFLANDLTVQQRALLKVFASSKDKEVLKLRKDLEDSIKEMNAASDVYIPRGRDKKMHEYATKFEKKIEKIIDLAPPAENPEEIELPKELDANAVEKAEKDVAKFQKDIDAGIAKIKAIVTNAKPYSKGADRLAEKERLIIESAHKRLQKLVLDYDSIVKKLSAADLKALRGNKGPDIQGFQLKNHRITREVDASVKKMTETLNAARKTLG